MPDETPVEAREVRPWRPGDGPLRTRSWGLRGPAVEVHVEGAWRTAQVRQREDRADGTVAVQVELLLPSVGASTVRAYTWDPRSIRPVRDADEAPTEMEWDAAGRIVRTTQTPDA